MYTENNHIGTYIELNKAKKVLPIQVLFNLFPPETSAGVFHMMLSKVDKHLQ